MKNKPYISLFFFVLIGVIPFFAAFIYAILYSFGIIGALNEGFTIHYWAEVLQSGEFFNSFFYSAAIAFFSLVISISLALWISLKFRQRLNKGPVSFISYLPLAIPGVVAGFFSLQLFSKSGFFARISYQLGFMRAPAQFPDLVNDSYAFGIIITFITLVLPFFVLLFLNVYKNERIEELSMLAKSLGAKDRQVSLKVFLPIILRKTRVLILLYFVFLVGAYEVPLILGQESPQMLSVFIIREMKQQFDITKIPEAYVVAVMYTLLVSTAAIVLFSFKKKESYET